MAKKVEMTRAELEARKEILNTKIAKTKAGKEYNEMLLEQLKGY